MVGEEGMRVCFTVFADTKVLMPDAGAQMAHWERVYTHLGGESNVTLLGVNQPGHSTQAIDPFMLNEPPSVAGFPSLLAMRDNPMEDGMPSAPPWKLSAFCSKRNDPHWWAEGGGFSMATATQIGHSGIPPTRGATVLFEPPPAGRHPDWTDPGKWRQFGRSLSFKGTVGGNFYSDYDARSEVYPEGVVRACAVEFLGNIPQP
jgi:hypothetical protein